MPGLLKTSNPALNAKTFEGHVAIAGEAMTLQGTVNKTGFLLFCATATAAYTWWLAHTQPGAVAPWLWGGLIGGLVFALVTIFKKEWAPVTAPVYALCEGLALGGISAVLNIAYPGIAIQALGLTFGVTAVMLMLYTTGALRATPKFTMGVVAATGGIFLVYLIDLVLGFFGHHVSMLYSNGALGIGVSVVIVIVAALNLILDFDFVESGVHAGAAKYMEWYGAFGIMVTLVWMYIEILRLLSKSRSR
ncbi:MAG: Bax inhibitor-1/YccA family protein [Acidobacteriota bacterium]|nr:Bax inhibitor-1/YccA family protein [Acidobacteriota bacterium]